MKKKLRASLTVALTSGLLLAATACAPTPGATESQAQNGQNTPATQQPIFPKGGAKHIAFESPLRSMHTFPAKWNGGSGWTQAGVGQVVAMPHHIGFTHIQADKTTGFKIYNDKGEIVADVGVPEEVKSGLFGITYTAVEDFWQDGKMFHVLAQVGYDGNKNPVVVFTSFDENANQIARNAAYPKNKEFSLEAKHGAVVLQDMDVKGEDKIYNLVTGEFDVAPKGPNGEDWEGRIDGVDIFAGKRSLVTKDWELPYTMFDPVGKYMGAVRLDENSSHKGVCDLIDPHTGKVVDGTDNGCVGDWESAVNDDDPTSLSNGVVLHKTLEGKNGIYNNEVLFDPSSGKSLTVNPQDSISGVQGVDDEGNFYAMRYDNSGEKKAPVVVSLNPNNGSTPTILEGATVAPIAVSGNGIAAFSEEGNNSSSGTISFVLPKK